MISGVFFREKREPRHWLPARSGPDRVSGKKVRHIRLLSCARKGLKVRHRLGFAHQMMRGLSKSTALNLPNSRTFFSKGSMIR